MTSLLRLDRLLSLYIFSPSVRFRGSRGESKIPILMYHSISDLVENGVHPYYQTTTTPRVFAEHMRFLHENDYRVLNLKQIKDFQTSTENQGRKAVVLTFDDGFRDFYANATPILLKYGFPATVFLPTAFIHHARRRFKGRECLSWNEVRDLRKKGFYFGSHTVSHGELIRMRAKEIEFELRQSQEIIEHEVGEPVEAFSYPFAFPDQNREFISQLRGMLHRYGYKYGVCTRIGRVSGRDDLTSLRRLPINSFDDISFFKAKLEGGYDWVVFAQFLWKALRGNRKRTPKGTVSCGA